MGGNRAEGRLAAELYPVRYLQRAGMVTIPSFAKNLLDWFDTLSTCPEKNKVTTPMCLKKASIEGFK